MKLSNPALFVILASFAAMLLLPPGGRSLQASGKEMRTLDNSVFGRGESIKFMVYYNSRLTGNVRAGEASLEVQPTTMFVSGRPTMHVVGLVNSRGLFNFFFRVENRYDTYIDNAAIAPLRFSRNIREGNYSRDEAVTFDHIRGVAVSNRATTEIIPYTQDLISSFYYARTLDVSGARPGDAFSVNFFFGDTVYVSRIVYEGREQITTRLGTFNTLKFKPEVLEGQVFSQPYPMTMWVSDDRNKVPVLIESGLVVGNIRMELSEFSGLRYPLRSRVR
jgi:hypothetical protein